MAFQSSWQASRVLQKNLRAIKFLDTMEKIIPWNEMVSQIEIVREKNEWIWRPTIPTLKLFKMYCLQQRFNLSDPLVEEHIYDRSSFQKFLDIDIVVDQIPDETTLCRFRKLLNDSHLQEDLFGIINRKLEEKWLIVETWTIMDATIIQAPSSTKNKEEKRDPEMASTQKNNQRYFGMKTHIGVDSKNWIVHTVLCTSANVHDSVVDQELQHGKEEEIYWDSAYHSKEKEENATKLWKLFMVCRKWSRNKVLTDDDRSRNKFCSSIRCKVEHTFWIIKNTRWHRKVHYKWIHKNEMQRYMLCWLANIYRMRNHLLA